MNDVINDIKKLWKDIFGDKDEYIDMVLSHYYSPDLSRQYYESGRLISSSLVIPYLFTNNCDINFNLYGGISSEKFTLGNASVEDKKHNYHEFYSKSNFTITGEYLSGLMTVEDRRGKGYMKRMIKEIEGEALRRGSSFTFLIPADDELRNYYSKLGYENSANKGIVKVNVSDKDIIYKIESTLGDSSVGNCSEVIRINNTSNISKYIIPIKREYESIVCKKSGIYILHSLGQWFDIFNDVIFDGGEVIISIDENRKINACLMYKYNGKLMPVFGNNQIISKLILYAIKNHFIYNSIGHTQNVLFEIEFQDNYEGIRFFNFFCTLLSTQKSNKTIPSTKMCIEQIPEISINFEERNYGMVKFLVGGNNNSDKLAMANAYDIHFLFMLD